MKNIVIIDLGWGGLLTAYKIFRNNYCIMSDNINVIYIASPIFTYNMTRDEKITSLNEYLLSINIHLKPAVIIIACNSLSSLYCFTDYSRNSSQVINILEENCKEISTNYKENDKVIIFASNLTISENSYMNFLNERMIDKKNIVCIPLTKLAKEIEANMNGIKVKELIKNTISNKVNVNNNSNIHVVLGCTHYEYIINVFKDEFRINGYKHVCFTHGSDYVAMKINNGMRIKSKRLLILSYNQPISKHIKENLLNYYKDNNIRNALDNLIIFQDFSKIELDN